MSGGTEVSVTARTDHSYVVEVHSSAGTTTHTVEVPDGLATELGWTDSEEPDLVRESFAFLLEREPATSILRQFSLDVIARYFPEYPSQVRRHGS